ncbi:MAG TPA: lipoyl domain-containing protein [Candidatus Limnocylindrales bacterium]|jgi:pyruvate/2-oxoglutarate dehydrogenase complex dihydrolipoamide acyltransferase (E2) component|nr:lipoyl domain-containing protein [Candidatus Binatia bacterium]HVR15336.1 lipoyl domain-containing protein [Candidatus Limnocylindrales bacterium]
MKKDVVIPRLGSSDESDEVRILRWIKNQGDKVRKGEALLEVETDKVNVEIEAPDNGELLEISAREGDFIKFGAVVAVIDKTD